MPTRGGMPVRAKAADHEFGLHRVGSVDDNGADATGCRPRAVPWSGLRHCGGNPPLPGNGVQLGADIDSGKSPATTTVASAGATCWA
ncbi:MAG: hypothetical protein IPL45_04040 [Actinomycetales bacterium]|nr:hypothetical protein [Actinomycetales bacterium]